MNRTPLLVGAVFLGIVGTGALWLGPKLVRRHGPATPPTDRRDVGERPARDETRRSRTPTSATRPPSRGAAAPRRIPALIVSTPDGAPLALGPDALRFAGAVDSRGYLGTWVMAEGFAWTRIPATDGDGVVRVRLSAAAPDLVLTVLEADGKPASDVPVSVGVDGLDALTTDALGHVRLESMPAGVLRVDVGGNVRASPPIRVRMGRDREAQALLEPGWSVAVQVVDDAGSPVAGAEILASGFDGPRTHAPKVADGARAITSGADGVARWTTRVEERLAITVAAQGFETTTVRAAFPDPRAPLSSALVVSLAKERGWVGGTLRWPSVATPVPVVWAEPAVLAPIREWLGREDAVFEHRLAVRLDRSHEEAPFELRGLDPTVTWRLSLRGSVIAEDHVLDLSEPSSHELRFRPEFERADVGPVADLTKGDPTTSLRGRVTDVKGSPMQGVTVGADGLRGITDVDGMFVVPGISKGRSLDVVYGWINGADCGNANPSEFTPWFQVHVVASDDLLALTLPRAAAVRLRLTDGLTGKPLSWARVLILDGEGSVRFDAPVATRDGHVALLGLVPGTAGTLVAFAPGLRREVPLALKAGETIDAGEVGLVRGGRVIGTVRDRAGAAVAGAAVAAMEDGRLERGGRSNAYGRDLVLRRTTSDAKGAFVLEGLDTSRPAAIGIAADGYAPTARRVLWNEGDDATVSAILTRGGSVKLQLLDPSGARVSGAFVELEDARTGVRVIDVLRRAALGSFVASSDDVRRASASFLLEDPRAPGIYRIGPVESGPYDIVVTCPGFQAQRAKLTVPDADLGSRRPIPLEALDWRLELTPTADGK